MTGDLVAKPLGQVALANVADLFSLAELEDLSPVMRRRLAPYRERTSVEIGDLPNGPPFEAFIEEMMGIEGWRIPRSMRAALLAEAERPKRGEIERGLIAALEAHWTAAVPLQFELADSKPVVKRADAAPPRDDAPKRSGQAGVSERAERAPKAAAAPRAPKEPEVDPERATWIRQVCMERLSACKEKGLAEPVLLAGVRHRATAVYPDLTPREVILVLRSLEDTGRVRHTANRWMLAARLSW